MTEKDWLVFTPAQREAAIEKSESTDFKIDPRIIDNPLVSSLGDAVIVLGNSVAGADILDNPEYGPVWIELLGVLPKRRIDSDILFLPPVV